MWMDLNKDVVQQLGNGLPADFMPILKHFPNNQTKTFLKLLDDFTGALQQEMKAHRDSFDPGKATYN